MFTSFPRISKCNLARPAAGKPYQTGLTRVGRHVRLGYGAPCWFMPRKSWRVRECGCIAAEYVLHARCFIHTTALDCQYFTPNVFKFAFEVRGVRCVVRGHLGKIYQQKTYRTGRKSLVPSLAATKNCCAY